MVAVSPTGISAMRFILAIVPILVYSIVCCNAFRTPPLHRMDSNKTIPTVNMIGVPRSNFDRLVYKSTLVDQEEMNESIPPTLAKIQKQSYTDQTKLSPNPQQIGRLGTWYLDRLEDSYAYTERHVKCPFFRRRYGDILDSIEGLVRFFLIRPYFQDSCPLLGPKISCRPMGKRTKKKHLSIDVILEILRKDWRSSIIEKGTIDATIPNEKGYYVTGKMSTNIYRDDCEFLSPDPDLPITGLRKYVGVAAHLFDSKVSHSKLYSLREVPGAGHPTIMAEWKMDLTINLPWKPKLKEFTGSTLYFLDEEHLICRHQETWDMSAIELFWDMLPTWKELKSTMNRNKHKTSKTKGSRCPFARLSSWITQHQVDLSRTTLSLDSSKTQELDPSLQHNTTAIVHR